MITVNESSLDKTVDGLFEKMTSAVQQLYVSADKRIEVFKQKSWGPGWTFRFRQDSDKYINKQFALDNRLFFKTRKETLEFAVGVLQHHDKKPMNLPVLKNRSETVVFWAETPLGIESFRADDIVDPWVVICRTQGSIKEQEDFEAWLHSKQLYKQDFKTRKEAIKGFLKCYYDDQSVCFDWLEKALSCND